MTIETPFLLYNSCQFLDVKKSNRVASVGYERVRTRADDAVAEEVGPCVRAVFL
jgi:hypothetical protein